jgi:hypothetical protein
VQTHYGMYVEVPSPEQRVARTARRRASRRSSAITSELHIPRTPAEVRAAAKSVKPTVRLAASWKVSFTSHDADVGDGVNNVLALAYVAVSSLTQLHVMTLSRARRDVVSPTSFETSAADALAAYVEIAHTAVLTARDVDALTASLAAAFEASHLAELCRPRTARVVANGGAPRELVSITATATQRALVALTTFDNDCLLRASDIDLSAAAIGGVRAHE